MKSRKRNVTTGHSILVVTARLFHIACTYILLSGSAQAQGSFYTATQSELAGQPGTIIRQEPALGAPDGATGLRILYRSTGLRNEPIAASALVVIPRGSPQGDRPIVAWAHPTSGIVQKCAPSLARHKFDGIQGLGRMIGRGYVVVATDYPGLGTPGTHPYLVGVSEARAVIDSVRAVRTLPDVGGGSRYAAWGHSQGGQAVLFTGIISERYAPELDLVGVAAAAPATDLRTLMRDDFATTGGKNLTAMTLWSWARVYGASIDKVVEPAAMPTVDALANKCLETIFDFLERQHTGKPLETTFLSVPDVTRIDPWQSLMKENTPGVLPKRLPVLLAQGTGDTTVRSVVTESYMRSLCAAGSAVRMMVLPNIGHAFIGRDSADAAVDWMTDRFEAKLAPSDC
jgi:acetyl esterase/lipase